MKKKIFLKTKFKIFPFLISFFVTFLRKTKIWTIKGIFDYILAELSKNGGKRVNSNILNYVNVEAFGLEKIYNHLNE